MKNARRRTIEVVKGQIDLEFLAGMAARMETAFFSYGDFRRNYRGQYTSEFLRDVRAVLLPFVEKWRRKQGVRVGGNALIFCLERYLLYLLGGRTRGGVIAAGNSEYLIDAANGAAIQFTCKQIPHAYFKPGDYNESPGFVGETKRDLDIVADNYYRGRQGD